MQSWAAGFYIAILQFNSRIVLLSNSGQVSLGVTWVRALDWILRQEALLLPLLWLFQSLRRTSKFLRRLIQFIRAYLYPLNWHVAMDVRIKTNVSFLQPLLSHKTFQEFVFLDWLIKENFIVGQNKNAISHCIILPWADFPLNIGIVMCQLGRLVLWN